MKEYFDKVQEAFESGDEGKFTAAVRNWLGTEEENPFKDNTTEHALFFSAKKAYSTWQSGAINCRSSKVRMVKYIRQMMEIGTENPYKNKTKAKKVEKKEEIYVLGVLPEDKTIEQLKKIEECEKKIDTIVEEEPKGFFARRKKR